MDFTMKTMSNYCVFLVPAGQKYLTRVWEYKNTKDKKKKTVTFHNPFADHFLYRHIIYNYNNICHTSHSI